MKKHLSVFGLFARSSIFKVLVILLSMSIIEIAAFYFELQDAITSYQALGSNGLKMVSLEKIIDLSAINVYFRVALVLMTVVLCLPGCSFKSNTSYTLRRLSVSERATFASQSVYNLLAYMILFAVQISVAFALSQYYVISVPAECVSNQTVMLAFFRNDFLHSLLPLDEIGLWIRNVLLIVTLGLAVAEFPYKQRRKKFSATAIAIAMYIVVFFDRGIGDISHLVETVIVVSIILIEICYGLFAKEASAND